MLPLTGELHNQDQQDRNQEFDVDPRTNLLDPGQLSENATVPTALSHLINGTLYLELVFHTCARVFTSKLPIHPFFVVDAVTIPS